MKQIIKTRNVRGNRVKQTGISLKKRKKKRKKGAARCARLVNCMAEKKRQDCLGSLKIDFKCLVMCECCEIQTFSLI